MMSPGPGTKPTPAPHLRWLIDTKQTLKTVDGKPISVFEFQHQPDDKILSAWARHFRNHYCKDDQIDELRKGTKLSRAEYLYKIKFPDQTEAPGPSIRAGDFSEILVSDYLQFVLGYWLPRTRYDNKVIRNDSTKGTDVLGFKLVSIGKDDPKDTLALFETKAQFSGKKPEGRLQTALTDSIKDEIRRAESLNAIKQRFIARKLRLKVQMIERFQNPEDRPYTEIYGAVAVVSSALFNKADIEATDATKHPQAANLALIVIHGPSMMDLVHELYRRAADEA